MAAREHVIEPASLHDAFHAALHDHRDLPARLWARDHRLWRDDPTEISNRLGWLDAPERFAGEVGTWERIASAAQDDGLRRAVVVGMGGSSLFPDVIARTHEATRLAVQVLDSTHPAAVRRVLDLPADETLIVVASKSGTTLETRSHLDTIWEHRVERVEEPGRGFLAITDPGSELAELAADRGFREVVLGDPDVGGRFSAMTPFGLVPAALQGIDLSTLVDRAVDEVGRTRILDGEVAPAYRLGVLIGVAATQGRDKVTVVLPDEIAAFGAWIEQLVAESLGKDGISVVPLVDERPQDVGPADDRLHVVVGQDDVAARLIGTGDPVAHLPVAGPSDLGALCVQWEVATAVAGAVLRVQPFDQPDVAAAKEATAEVLERGLSDVAVDDLEAALAAVRTGDLVALTGFVDPSGAAADGLGAARRSIQERTGAATTLGVGPRYLHSTGQLHKGGSDRIVVIQVVAAPNDDVAIPGRDIGFATLLAAQAEGDLAALRRRGRRAFRVPLDDLLALADAGGR